MSKIAKLFLVGSSIFFLSSVSLAIPVPVAVPVHDERPDIPIAKVFTGHDGDHIPVAEAVPIVGGYPEPSAPPMEEDFYHRDTSTLDRNKQADLQRKEDKKDAHDHEDSVQFARLSGIEGGVRRFERDFNKMLLRFDEVFKQDKLSNLDSKDSQLNIGDYAMSIGKAYFFNTQGSLLGDVVRNTEISHLEKVVSGLKGQFGAFDKILTNYKGEHYSEIEAIYSSAKEYYVDNRPSALNFGVVVSILTVINDAEQAMNRAEIDALEYKLDVLRVRLKAINHVLGKKYLNAVHDGDVEKANLHLGLGADPHVRNKAGQNALELAWDNHEMLKHVAGVGKKAMVNSEFSDYKLPLDHAVTEHNANKVSVLMEHGAKNVESFSEESSLHKAAGSGFVDGVEAMLKHDVDPNTTYIDTKDMSYLSTIYLHMVSRVAYFFGYSKDGETPLHTVTEKAIDKVKDGKTAEEELAIMKLLKDKGADIDLHKYYGKSVRKDIHELCSKGQNPDFCSKAESILGMTSNKQVK